MELTPVIPFEPIRTEKLPNGEQWIAQVKWDGVRIMTYYDGCSVQLFNRKLNERTLQFPELTDIKGFCKAKSVILDGEVIALSEGKPSFHQVMRRDGVRRADRIKFAVKTVPVIYMVFDVLYFDNTWLLDKPLYERQLILEEILKQNQTVQKVESFKEMESLYQAICRQNMEGIVCKDLNSAYQIAGKDMRWQKRKNYRDIIAVIGGATFNGNVVNSILLGLYDQQEKLWYVGHAGTGKLTHDDWAQLTIDLRRLEIKESPFDNQVSRSAQVMWVRPQLTVKVQFIEWTSGGTLRQPSIQAFVEAPPESCLFE